MASNFNKNRFIRKTINFTNGASLTASSNMQDVNILLLGETGVGKSTFINALYNYFSHEAFEHAEQNELLYLIPVFFNVTLDNFEQKQIKIGEDKNELDATGKSATLFPKLHKIKINSLNITLNIIDTPGIGDVEGFLKDEENSRNLIKFLRDYESLNAICILLKPNHARLDIRFRFCIKELMCRLDKTSVPNIVFCFTNARGTSYKPGDTLPSLVGFMKDISKESGVEIPIKPENIFCFDNESFRYLSAIHQGIKYSSQERSDFDLSWQKSSKEAQRFLSYVSGLPIHMLSNMFNLNTAKQLLIKLSEIIAYTCKIIQLNIKLAEDKNNEVITNPEDVNIISNFAIQKIDYNRVHLPYTRTVCSDPKCTKVIRSDGIDKIDYATICHKYCSCVKIKTNMVNVSELLKCKAMKTTEYCSVCRHHYTKHMHINYEMVEKIHYVSDPRIQEMIKRNVNKNIILNEILDGINKVVNYFLNEQEEIIKISVQLACFAKTNALVSFNDELNSYLDILIREEESKHQLSGNDGKILQGLRDVQKSYLEQKDIMLRAIRENKNPQITIQDFDDLVKKLYGLRNTGSRIKQLVESD